MVPLQLMKRSKLSRTSACSASRRASASVCSRARPDCSSSSDVSCAETTAAGSQRESKSRECDPSRATCLVHGREVCDGVEGVAAGQHAVAQAGRRRLHRGRRWLRGGSGCGGGVRSEAAPPHGPLRHRGARLQRHRLAARCSSAQSGMPRQMRVKSARQCARRTDEDASPLALPAHGPLLAQRQRALIQPPHALLRAERRCGSAPLRAPQRARGRNGKTARALRRSGAPAGPPVSRRRRPRTRALRFALSSQSQKRSASVEARREGA